MQDRSLGTAVWKTSKSEKNCTRGLYTILFNDRAHLYQVKPGYEDSKARAFLLHDESTTVGGKPGSASVLLLQQEISDGNKDCALKKYMEGTIIVKTHIEGIYVAYGPYIEGNSSALQRLIPNPSSLRGSDPSLINLKANLGMYKLCDYY